MKKLIISTVLAAATSMAAFGQGYISLLNNTKAVQLNGVAAGGINIGFIWDAGSGNTLSFGANPWANLLALPGGWTWMASGGTNAWCLTAAAPPPAVGNFNDNVLNVTGGSSGQAISMYVIAWGGGSQANYTVAAGALAPVGVSSEFDWTLGSASAPGNGIGTVGTSWTVPNALPVPEPTTLALAGLGGLSLLLFRRKKA